MKVQEALKAAVEAMETCKSHRYEGREANVFSQWFDEKLIAKSLDECKSALSDIEKCEPVAEVVNNPWPQGIMPADPSGRWYQIQCLPHEMLPHGTKLYTSPISKED